MLFAKKLRQTARSAISFDVSGKVIYMNTFTKSLASTIRISYMVLPPRLLERFYDKLGFYSCTVFIDLYNFIISGIFYRIDLFPSEKLYDQSVQIFRPSPYDHLHYASDISEKAVFPANVPTNPENFTIAANPAYRFDFVSNRNSADA